MIFIYRVGSVSSSSLSLAVSGYLDALLVLAVSVSGDFLSVVFLPHDSYKGHCPTS